jgi:hypothetical protein
MSSTQRVESIGSVSFQANFAIQNVSIDSMRAAGKGEAMAERFKKIGYQQNKRH